MPSEDTTRDEKEFLDSKSSNVSEADVTKDPKTPWPRREICEVYTGNYRNNKFHGALRLQNRKNPSRCRSRTDPDVSGGRLQVA